jgi:hypothetical protein
MSVLTRITRCHIPEDNILQSHHHENIKSYIDKEDIFKTTVRDESLHEINTDNEVKVVNFATFKNPGQKYNDQHCNVHTLI